MPNTINKLDDYRLIEFLVDNHPNIYFLSKQTIDDYITKIKNIFKTRKEDLKREGFKLIFDTSRVDSIDVLDFWERLQIDAIKYLKWHDPDEFPVDKPKKAEKKHLSGKEIIYNKITETSLGVYNLKKYFKAFVDFERLLYGAEEFYRDHVYHIIRVWLIGQLLIKQGITDGFLIEIPEDKEHLVKDAQLPRSHKNSNTLYIGEEDAIWCLIALNHDLGYPLSKVEEINSSLKRMLKYFAKTGLEEFSFSFPQQNQFINDSILKYISSKIYSDRKRRHEFDTHIQAKYYLKFSRSFELFHHGLISCIVLVKNLIYFMETNFDHNPSTNLGDAGEARQFVIRREILRAIATHTCPEIYHLKPNTFSFLLLIADEMQFWGRPTFESLALGRNENSEVILTEFSKDRVSFEIKCDPQPDHKPDSLMGYFLAKAGFFKKILRVAVDTNVRQFTLEFSITDGMGTKYKFISKPQERPQMLLNGAPIDYKPMEKLVSLHKDRKDSFDKMVKSIDKYKLFQ
jgi:hypothetical protein